MEAAERKRPRVTEHVATSAKPAASLRLRLLRARIDDAQRRWNHLVGGDLLVVDSTLSWLAEEFAVVRQCALNLLADEIPRSAIAIAANALARIARDRLVLIRLQRGEHRSALTLLRECGFSYRLSDAVLRPRAEQLTRVCCSEQRTSPVFRVIDNALPKALLGSLQSAFASDAPFWDEHQYWTEDAFFSYEVPLGDGSDVSHPAAIAAILVAKIAAAAAPDLVAQAPSGRPCYAEWWCHTKPHCAGHLLHFDQSDDARVPLVSTVLYLSEDGVGGCTLVTEQAMSDSMLGMTGWLCEPKENRLLLFDGRLLHGVVPGLGAPPPATKSIFSAQGADVADKRARPPRRCTLMVAICGDRTQRGERHGLEMPTKQFQVEGSPKKWVEARCRTLSLC